MFLSWGSGAKPWGRNCNEEQFSTPNHWDGMLEVVAVSGVVHLGQIQTGLRYAKRIAQVCIASEVIKLITLKIQYIFF
jgi:hypothetical protein